MKDFLRKNLEIKIVSIIFFATEMILYILIAPFFGVDSISIKLAWEMVLVAIVLTALQYIIYTSNLLGNIRVWAKLTLHYLSIVVLGLIFTKVFNWFRLNINNIATALSIFTLCFLTLTASMGTYAKLTGDRLNEQLKAYKSKKQEKK